MATDLTDHELRQFMRNIMKAKGLTVSSWSKLAGRSEGTLRQFFDDPTRSMKTVTLKSYLGAVGMTLADIKKRPGGFSEDSAAFVSHRQKNLEDEVNYPVIPLTGYVSFGGRVMPYDPSENDIDAEIDANAFISKFAQKTYKVMAFKTKNNSIFPKDWMVYYYAENSPEKCLHKLCVVTLADGNCYIRELQPGSIPGRYTLLSENSAPIENAVVKSAFQIIIIEPR